jgi:predicted transcriptional regulator
MSVEYNGPEFDGHTYDRDEDYQRLGHQIRRVFDVMKDGAWRSLQDLTRQTGDPEASVSARIRDLRKDKFGKWIITRQRMVSGKGRGSWIYRLEGKQ